ncbi:hypothetical protein CVT26_014287 [Gymnopilus dilepis]|uniref:F-box domain-containing protein n=1 Tax=Gymnopilus dilepis TaxID=231916 RepID=A0A409Y985_9AGAR|nr:hypothetical protein CVT26_014287 [Gymnopilus dilepis]
MYRALLVRELQQQIFENFLPSFDVESLTFAEADSFVKYLPDREARKTLLNAALTCRNLKEAALDALWWAVDDLTPLCAMLEGFRETEDSVAHTFDYVVRGSIARSEVDRFFHYAKRIKLLHCRRSPSVSSTSYMRILWAKLTLLVSPTLRVLNVSNEWDMQGVHPDATALRAIIDSLADLAPGLLGLSLWHEMTSDCLQDIRGLPKLKHLRLNNSFPLYQQHQQDDEVEYQVLGDVFQSNLSSLSRLRRLKLTGHLYIASVKAVSSPASLTFSALVKMELTPHFPGSVEELTSLFRLATFPKLESLRAGPYDCLSQTRISDLRQFFASLVQATTPGHFRFLALFCSWEMDTLFQVPLSSIPELLHLRLAGLDTDVLTPIDTQDVSSMGSAWPHLSELSLKSPIGLAFNVVVEIALRFKELRRLDLHVDCRVIPEPGAVPILDRPLFAHFSMASGDSFPENPVQVARCLDRLFPQLKELDQELVTIPSLKITMHRVFFIPELLDQNFQNFRTDFDEKKLVSTLVPEISSYENFLPNGKTRETLLNAALTCRAFKKPALDVLWWAMDDLTPLFCLLRGYGIVEPDDYEYIDVIEGPICDSECELFFDYADRIKLFCAVKDTWPGSTPCMQILRASKRSCLLGSLKYIFCLKSVPELVFLPSSRLQVVSAVMNDSLATDFRAFIGSLPSISPRLAGLYLAYEVTEGCLRSIERLTELKSLYIYNGFFHDDTTHEEFGDLAVDANFVQNLSSFSNLSSLKLSGNIDFGLGLSEEYCLPWIFPAVTVLECQADLRDDISVLTRFLQIARFPQLESFTASHYEPEDSDVDERNWLEFSKALTTAAPPSLQTLVLWSTDCPRLNIHLSSISGVFQFHRLTSFSTDMLYPISMAEAKSMTDAWPNLCCLELRTAVSLEAFVSFAQRFEQLRKLSVPLDCARCPPLEDIPILSRPLSTLKVISRGQIPPKDPIKVAHCIDRLFPDVEEVSLPFGGKALREKWREVNSILRALQLARKDQKLRDS